MKYKLQHWIPTAFIGLALSTSAVFGAAEITVSTFDTGPLPGGTWSWWGGATINWDGAQDHSGNGGGSMYVNHPVAGDSIMIAQAFSGIQWDGGVVHDLTTYTNISLWLKWDTTSPMGISTFNTEGSGGLALGLNDAANGQWNSWGEANRHFLPSVLIPNAASNGWVHLNYPLNAQIPNINQIMALLYNDWKPAPWSAVAAFWIDDVVIQPSALDVIPPPTVYLDRAVRGLKQFANEGPTYDRQNIRTETADITWYGRQKPVSYSFTLAEMPSGAHAGYYVDLNICPQPQAQQNYSDPDWSSPNDLYLVLTLQGDGSVTAGCYFKTNQPNANGMFNPPDTAAGLMGPRITGAPALGTWTLTFTSDTEATLTAPNNATSSLTLPPDVAALFANPDGTNGMFYIGSSMGYNLNNNYGQSVTFSRIAISGAGTSFTNDLTTGTLDPNLRLMSQHYNEGGPWTTTPPNQIFVTSDDAYWFHWTLPAGNFAPVTLNSLSGGTWTDPGVSSNIFVNGGERWVKIPNSALPGTGQGYFALIKRVFSKLQILLPGETAAPGTLTGKTGTPDAQQVGIPFPVTVNAVDDNWYHVASAPGDQITLSSTDPAFSWPSTFAVYLANGTITFDTVNLPVSLGTAVNTNTITATDATDGTKTANTSPAVTVNP